MLFCLDIPEKYKKLPRGKVNAASPILGLRQNKKSILLYRSLAVAIVVGFFVFLISQLTRCVRGVSAGLFLLVGLIPPLLLFFLFEPIWVRIAYRRWLISFSDDGKLIGNFT